MDLQVDLAVRESATGAPIAPPTPPSPPVAREPPLYADAITPVDLLGAGEAAGPIAQICLAREAQTPFVVGVVGPRGAGKSFALDRLVATIENLAGAATKSPTSPFHSQIVIARLDAAGLSGDPASALASAAFLALERDGEGGNYTDLADESAHAATDPRRAAQAAAERHEDSAKRLEAERAARDEVESKRARLTEALLYETPGSRIDMFARARRATIDARLRRFGLADGDSGRNYRDLVRDLSSLGAGSRFVLVLRAMWAYRGQLRWLAIAVTAFVLAFAIDRARSLNSDAALRNLGEGFAPAADWIIAHADWLERTIEGLIVVGLAALFINVWRAVGFSTLLSRGLRLLNADLRDRRRELDAKSARLERRVALLSGEVEAAGARAETLAKRAGPGAHLTRAPSPGFLKACDVPSWGARRFFAELGRVMSAADARVPAPQRLILAIDNLETLPRAEALRLIETAGALIGPGGVGLIACDPSALTDRGESLGVWTRRHFQICLDVAALASHDMQRLAARVLSSGLPPAAEFVFDAGDASVCEPLSPAETALLCALAPLTSGGPQAIKRLHNAYRLTRFAKAPRPIVALALAALTSDDAELAPALRAAMFAEGEAFEDPVGPARLIEAARVARAAHGARVKSGEARAAWRAARRYAPSDLPA